jgi:N-methylhydantoinase A
MATLDEARCAKSGRSGTDGRLARHCRYTQREKLPLDAIIEGPAILEQMDATTVLEPGDRARSGRAMATSSSTLARPEMRKS